MARKCIRQIGACARDYNLRTIIIDNYIHTDGGELYFTIGMEGEKDDQKRKDFAMLDISNVVML